MIYTPEVDALIDRVMADHPRTSASGQAEYYEAMHQELAPFARNLEIENRRLTALVKRIEIGYDLVEHLERQQDFSLRTFGPGKRTEGLIDHITKELAEVAANPDDLVEWVDVILLALDGAWRAGYEPQEICQTINAKLERNMAHTWPDWRTSDPGKAIEHVRESEALEIPSFLRKHRD